ncbi:flagellar basal body rod protein FlgB [bacterium]|nr:flagellar basal body rod protein FlgB [bacterium]
MIRSLFEQSPLPVLAKGMEGLSLRLTAITDNLANASTPGYKRKEVRFEEALAAAIAGQPRGLAERVAGVKPVLSADFRSRLRADGNNVDFDQEMVAAAQATGRSMAVSELLARNYGMLETAIRERMR